jgi:HTH-type transcriptional regulator/antitoxin HigA
MSAVYLEQITPVWNDFSKLVHVLHNEQDYTQAVALLDSLINSVGKNEKHPLASLMELVGVLIEQYEDAYIPEITDKEKMY